MHPVGPQSPKVYWRRRLAVLIVLAIILILAVWGIIAIVGAVGGGSGGAAAPAAPTSEATTTETAANSSAAASVPEAGGICTDADVDVLASSDARTYRVGDTAQIGMTITNKGAQPCRMDVGSAALTIIVKSGNDQIWSSDDCQTDSQSNVVSITPQQDMESSVPWPTARSGPGCKTGFASLKPGTYLVVAKAGDIESSPLTVTLQEAAPSTPAPSAT